MIRKDPVYGVVSPDLYPDQVFQLFLKCGQQFIKCSESRGITGFNPDLFAGEFVKTIIQRKLKDLGKIEITRQNIGFGSKGTGLYTTTGSSVSGILYGFALAHKFLDNRIGVEK